MQPSDLTCTPLFPFSRRWDIPDAVHLALLLEAAAPKAGNVHPAASFEDMTFVHFAASAVAVRQSFANLDDTQPLAIGQLILNAVRGMQEAVSRNTHLGSLLLFGPVVTAFAQHAECTPNSLRSSLARLTPADSQSVYQAIRLARPGGMGSREVDDVTGEAPPDLLQAMSQVAEFDAVARQYTGGFEDIFVRTLPWFEQELHAAQDVLQAICRLQVRWLAHEPDGLIVRKVGLEAARQVQHAAADTWQECAAYIPRFTDSNAYRSLDTLLRADDHRLNPGTTADLIAATLLVKLLRSAR